MGITERKEREKAQRRSAILKCARELILLQGIQQVSMEDIAQKAEISKATVYLYFSSKEVLFNEICEESARIFLERFKPLMKADITGLEAMKQFWYSYVEMFGDSDEIIIIYQVRNFINPGQPFVFLQDQKLSYLEGVLEATKTIIDKCKAEGVFDPELDSVRATRLLLSMFSAIVENAARIPSQVKKSPAIIEEMTNAFQIIIRGFAKDGINRESLNIGILMSNQQH